MSIAIENGYIYVDMEPKENAEKFTINIDDNLNEKITINIDDNPDEKSSDNSSDNSLWIWFLVIFVFAGILLFTTWYGNSHTKSAMTPRAKILSPRAYYFAK